MSIEDQIGNAVALRNVFGCWPSFHDAEIVSMRLERGPAAPFLESVIHVFKMTSEVDDRGYYVLTNHTLVSMRFNNIQLIELDGFNHQNALDGLEISPASDGQGRFVVAMPSNYGCEAKFNCDSIEVTNVEPFQPASS